MSTLRQYSHRVLFASAVFAACMGWLVSPAHARVFVGIGIPFYGPAFYPPPAYYPPPVYYAPPPVVYAPPQSLPPQSQAGGQSCYAESYVCPMERPVPSGSGCYCLGNGGQRVPGRAN